MAAIDIEAPKPFPTGSRVNWDAVVQVKDQNEVEQLRMAQVSAYTPGCMVNPSTADHDMTDKTGVWRSDGDMDPTACDPTSTPGGTWTLPSGLRIMVIRADDVDITAKQDDEIAATYPGRLAGSTAPRWRKVATTLLPAGTPIFDTNIRTFTSKVVNPTRDTDLIKFTAEECYCPEAWKT